MPAPPRGSDGVQSTVMRTPLVTLDQRFVFWSTDELAGSEVVKRRDRQHEVRTSSMNPGQEHKAVSLPRRITDARSVSFRIVGNLIVVSLERGIQAKLVG